MSEPSQATTTTPPPSKSPAPSKSRPQLVRPPLAVVPISGGNSTSGRLSSIREFNLPGSSHTEFTPLIPAPRVHKSHATANEAIDRSLPGPIPSLLHQGRKVNDSSTTTATTSQNQQKRTSSQFGGRQQQQHGISSQRPGFGGMVPSGVSGNSSAFRSSALGASAIAKAQIEAELESSVMATITTNEHDLEEGTSTATTAATKMEAKPIEPDFNPWEVSDPVQLPLHDPRNDLETQNHGGGGGCVEDEEAQIPFLDHDRQLQVDDLYVLQLPSQLPLQQTPQQTPQANQPQQQIQEQVYEKMHEFETPPFKPNLIGMEGFMGKLLFRKSGRVTFRLANGAEFDVHPSCTPKFLEELFLISIKSGSCYRMGPVAHRISVLPSIDTLGLADTIQQTMINQQQTQSQQNQNQQTDSHEEDELPLSLNHIESNQNVEVEMKHENTIPIPIPIPILHTTNTGTENHEVMEVVDDDDDEEIIQIAHPIPQQPSR